MNVSVCTNKYSRLQEEAAGETIRDRERVQRISDCAKTFLLSLLLYLGVIFLSALLQGGVEIFLSSFVIGIIAATLLSIITSGWIFSSTQFFCFCREERSFLSREGALKCLLKVNSEKSLSAKAKICSKVILQGGFVKANIRAEVTYLSDTAKLQLAFPLFALENLDEGEIKAPCYEDLEGRMLRGRCDVSSKETVGLSRFQFSQLFSSRFSTELVGVLFGVFSREEISRLQKFASETGTNVVDDESSQLYAEMIMHSPKIVAAEAIFLNWLKRIYPYLVLSSNFNDYRRAFLFVFFKFKYTPLGGAWKSLERFSGIIPSCLAIFRKDGELRYYSSDCPLGDMTWADFCQQVMKYSEKACSYRGFMGNWRGFQDFMEKGDRIFPEDDFCHLLYEENERNFIESPYALWDMKNLYAKNPTLRRKVEEGLEVLKEIECLGGDIQELIRLEHTVLDFD
ncbi:hypothetical protein [Chlamydiifrater volucris]|uniref:hypothetical protein n=1 Tax=Chlamydiifrater volucris TaxID=2681470 RepID=UPI001BD11AD9|nr:hypothetical protein [Chlamydiifrater volucris]